MKNAKRTAALAAGIITLPILTASPRGLPHYQTKSPSTWWP